MHEKANHATTENDEPPWCGHLNLGSRSRKGADSFTKHPHSCDRGVGVRGDCCGEREAVKVRVEVELREVRLYAYDLL